MYPFVIIWKTESLKELYESSSYGYVEELFEIINIIHGYIDNFIYEYDEKIKNEIKNNGAITIEKFYEMVNSEPYWDFIFFDIKYFDIRNKLWTEYKIDEKKLNEYFMLKIQIIK